MRMGLADKLICALSETQAFYEQMRESKMCQKENLASVIDYLYKKVEYE